MFEIKGKVNTAICYATIVEDAAIEQIRRMCVQLCWVEDNPQANNFWCKITCA